MLNGEFKRKVIFVTGKGGVGKSTITSVIASHLAKGGKKVLVIDADPAHSMPDVFGITDRVYGKNGGFVAKKDLTKVSDGLDLLVLNPINVRAKYVGNHRIMWLAELGKELGFFSHIDRMSEFFTLSDTLYRMYRQYDHFVIDNEPSAGTLDMVESIDGWLKAMSNVSKYALVFQLMLQNQLLDRQLATEVRKLIFDNGGEFLRSIETMLKAVKALFTDGERFQPIIISSPEDAVIRETHRLIDELTQRLGITAKSVIFNKVIQAEPVAKWHKERMAEFKASSVAQCYAVPLIADQVNLETAQNACSFIDFVENSIVAV